MIGLKVVRDAAETLPHIRQTKTPGREAALPQSPAQQRRGEDAFARRRAGNALQRCYISKSCSAFTVAFANYGHAITALRLTWSPPQFCPPDAFRTYEPHSDPFAAGRQKNANRCLRPSVPGSGRSRALPHPAVAAIEGTILPQAISCPKVPQPGQQDAQWPHALRLRGQG